MDDIKQSIKEQKIWSFLNDRLGNPYAAAAVMGNLYCESELRTEVLEFNYMEKIGMNSAQYTEAVDNGTYDNFVKDAAGYGLAQWTWGPRKKGLLEYAKSKNVSISDLDMQLEYLWKELNESYVGVLTSIKKASCVKEASDVVLTKFENPYDQGDWVKEKRASISEEFYQKFADISLEE